MKSIIEKKEINEKDLKKIYLNILKAIILVVYFLIINLSYENVNTEHFLQGIKLCTMIFLFIAIFIFELAYKKDSDDLAIQGIEVLVLATFTLTSQHISKKFHFNFKNYYLVASYIFAIYFVLKCIIIYTKGRKKMAENLSDIREIVKKDEPIKKEATKKNKAEDKKEKSNNTKTVETKKEEKPKTTRKRAATTKKTTNTKTAETKKEEKLKTTRKRATTTKKTATSEEEK